MSSPVKLVMIGDVKFSVHDPVFEHMFPKATASATDTCLILNDISVNIFSFALHYMYTFDAKNLDWLDPDELRVLMDFAIKHGNMRMVAVLMQKLKYDFQSQNFFALIEDIYAAGASWEFKAYFSEVIKKEVETRRQECPWSPASSMISGFERSPDALREVVDVLVSVWQGNSPDPPAKVVGAWGNGSGSDWNHNGNQTDSEVDSACDEPDRTNNTVNGPVAWQANNHEIGQALSRPPSNASPLRLPANCATHVDQTDNNEAAINNNNGIDGATALARCVYKLLEKVDDGDENTVGTVHPRRLRKG
jgi:hypothetical protein